MLHGPSNLSNVANDAKYHYNIILSYIYTNVFYKKKHSKYTNVKTLKT